MQVHNLIQGTPEWHAYRKNHFNASDAPAMLGCSPYKSRTELIREMATGLTAEVDQFTQRIFDDGHRYEALARPLAEKIIGADLYPVVGSNGRYSASFDGLPLSEADGFEHKSLNDELRALMGPGCEGHQLPKMYRAQMEQQCMVSGASRILFMASKWKGDELVEEYHCWYAPDFELRREILAGWVQLEADVAAYQPQQIAEKPLADAMETLPAIAVQIRGEVVASNMPAFQQRLSAYIASIKTDLVTDQDFANAEAAVKNCADTEKRIAATKEQVLGQVASIDEVIRALDDADAQLSKVRIHLEKEIKAKKEAIKAGILVKVQQDFRTHVDALEAEIAPLRLSFQARDFAGAMKNKRTLESLQNAVDTELAAGKIAVDAIAAGVRARLAWYKAEAAGYEVLFADLQTVIQKGDDDFKLLVQSRIDAQKKADEAKLEAARKELEAKAASAMLATAASAMADAVVTGTGVLQVSAEGVKHIPAAEVIATAPSLRLGQISERLGFTMTADFVLSLGFAPAATDKAAKLYHESDFPRICAALQRHIAAVQAKF
jgi:putative phage-type endonuclease